MQCSAVCTNQPPYNIMSSSTKLYSSPTSPSSITNIALSCKTFRVFGLHTPAWQNAATSANTTRKNEEHEIELISNAIVTALSDDAGGYGTAGFHVVRTSYFLFLFYV